MNASQILSSDMDGQNTNSKHKVDKTKSNIVQSSLSKGLSKLAIKKTGMKDFLVRSKSYNTTSSMLKRTFSIDLVGSPNKGKNEKELFNKNPQEVKKMQLLKKKSYSYQNQGDHLRN